MCYTNVKYIYNFLFWKIYVKLIAMTVYFFFFIVIDLYINFSSRVIQRK